MQKMISHFTLHNKIYFCYLTINGNLILYNTYKNIKIHCCKYLDAVSSLEFI